MNISFKFRNDALCVLPAILMLLCVFIAPLVWFIIHALTGIGSPLSIAERFWETSMSRVTLMALWTTFWISFVVTVTTLSISYPIAYFLTQNRGFRFSLVLFCIVVPYFTSVIVRTYSWMVLLGREGLVNQVLVSLDIIREPLTLLYSKTGIVIGMIYVLMPYMVLTLFASMKSIDPVFMRAARGLGAGGFFTFSRIYFPLSIHGVVSGGLIVFISAIGFFITPALMGGPSDVTAAMLIEQSVNVTFDWGEAAIQSILLLVATLVTYGIYYRVTDVRRMMGSAT